MSDEIQILLGLIEKKSTVTPLVGTFVSATATGCVVDVGNGRIPAKFGTSYLPEVNEPVWVWFIDGLPFMMGPSVAKPGQGTVVSVASGLVTLSTDFGTVVAPYASTLTPTAGQVLKLSWQGGAYAHSVMSTSPTPPAPPAPPALAVATATHVDTFTAVDGGSFNSTWWTSQLYASPSNLAAWFYGTKIANTIPSRAVIKSVQVYISADQILYDPPVFALHPHKSKPAGGPSLSSSTPVAIAPGWVTLPVSFGNALKSGGGSFGIGLNHGGYSILRSLTQDSQSGALRITSTY